MSYLVDSDITDKLITPFKTRDASYWAAVMARTDAQAEDIAQQLGVLAADIATPISNTFKDCLRAYFSMEICLDATEVANLDQGITDKYMAKYQIYGSRYKMLKSMLTKEMICGTVQSRGDRARGGVLYYG
jgi:hypothetical protein